MSENLGEYYDAKQPDCTLLSHRIRFSPLLPPRITAKQIRRTAVAARFASRARLLVNACEEILDGSCHFPSRDFQYFGRTGAHCKNVRAA
jgi:hypothetical protein